MVIITTLAGAGGGGVNEPINAVTPPCGNVGVGFIITTAGRADDFLPQHLLPAGYTPCLLPTANALIGFTIQGVPLLTLLAEEVPLPIGFPLAGGAIGEVGEVAYLASILLDVMHEMWLAHALPVYRTAGVVPPLVANRAALAVALRAAGEGAPRAGVVAIPLHVPRFARRALHVAMIAVALRAAVKIAELA